MVRFVRLCILCLYRLHLPDSAPNLKIQGYILTIFQIQLLALNCQYFANQPTSHPSSFKLMSLFDCLAQVARPFQYFVAQTPAFAFLLPMIVILALCLGLLYLSAVIGSKNFLLEINQATRTNLNHLFRVLSLLFQIYPYVLNIPLLECCALSLTHHLETSDTGSATLLIASFVFGSLIGFNLLNLLFTQQIQFPNPILSIKEFGIRSVLAEIIIVLLILQVNMAIKIAKLVFPPLILLLTIHYIEHAFRTLLRRAQLQSLYILALNIMLTVGFLLEFNHIDSTATVLLLSSFGAMLLAKFSEKTCSLNIIERNSKRNILRNLHLLHFHIKGVQTLQKIESLILCLPDNHSKTVLSHSLPSSDTLNAKQAFAQLRYQYISVILDSQNKASLIDDYLQYLHLLELNKQYVEASICINQLRQAQLIKINHKEHIKFNKGIQRYQSVFLDLRSEQLYFKINQQLRSSDDQSLSKLAQHFIEYRKCIDELQKGTIAMLETKIRLLQLLQSRRKLNQRKKTFDLAYSFASRLSNFELKLKAQQRDYDTILSRHLMQFYYAELKNDYIAAAKMQITSKQYNQSHNLETSEFLVTKISEDLSSIIILQMSKGLESQIDAPLQSAAARNNQILLDCLLPEPLRDQHKQLTNLFLTQNKFQILSQRRTLLVRCRGEIYKGYELQLFHKINSVDQLIFFAFLQPCSGSIICILLDQLDRVIGYSSSFETYLSQYLPNQDIIHQHIENYMPKFLQQKEASYKGEVESIFCSSCKISYKVVQRYNVQYLMISYVDHNINLQNTNDSQNEIITINKPYQFEIYQYVDHPMDSIPIKLLEVDNIPLTGSLQAGLSPVCNELNQLVGKSSSKQDRVLQNNKDQGLEKLSSSYSRNALQDSRYFRKYILIKQFIDRPIHSKSYDLSLKFMLTAFIIGICANSIILASLLKDIEKVTNDLDLISIESYFATPAQICVASQTCILNYVILHKLTQVISQETADEKTQFALHAINRSFELMKDSFASQLNNQNLQNFLSEDIELRQENFTALNDKKKVFKLKNALIYMLNAQLTITNIDYLHILELQRQNGDFAFFMTNLQIISMRLHDIAVEIQLSNSNRNQQLISDWKLFLIKITLCQLVPIYLAVQYYIYQQKLKSRQFHLILQINQELSSLEQHNLQLMVNVLSKPDVNLNYKFDMKQKESQLDAYREKYEKKKTDLDQEHGFFQFKSQMIQIYVCLLLLFLSHFGPYYSTNLLSESYFTKLSNTAILLNGFSSVSSSTSSVYQLKEVSYLIQSPASLFAYLENNVESALEELNKSILLELGEINQFAQYLSALDLQDFLVDESFTSLFKDVKGNLICNHMVRFDKSKAMPHCDSAYQGVMKLGLVNTLFEIYNQIYTEYQSTEGFQLKKRVEIAKLDEIEAGIITSDVLLKIKNELFQGVQKIASDSIRLIQVQPALKQIITVVLFVYDFLAMTLLWTYVRKKGLEDYTIQKNMLRIIPAPQLYADQEFERRVKQLIYKNSM